LFYRVRPVYLTVRLPFVFYQARRKTYGSYLIVEKVIYMCICDSSYPRKLAFSYLDELSKEFQRSYGDKIESVTRPYAFMGFGKFLYLFPEKSLKENKELMIRYIYFKDYTTV
jgi:hypothetical protein